MSHALIKFHEASLGASFLIHERGDKLAISAHHGRQANSEHGLLRSSDEMGQFKPKTAYY